VSSAPACGCQDAQRIGEAGAETTRARRKAFWALFRPEKGLAGRRPVKAFAAECHPKREALDCHVAALLAMTA